MKKRLLQMFFLCLPLAVLLTVSAGADGGLPLDIEYSEGDRVYADTGESGIGWSFQGERPVVLTLDNFQGKSIGLGFDVLDAPIYGNIEVHLTNGSLNTMQRLSISGEVTIKGNGTLLIKSSDNDAALFVDSLQIEEPLRMIGGTKEGDKNPLTIRNGKAVTSDGKSATYVVFVPSGSEGDIPAFPSDGANLADRKEFPDTPSGISYTTLFQATGYNASPIKYARGITASGNTARLHDENERGSDSTYRLAEYTGNGIQEISERYFRISDFTESGYAYAENSNNSANGVIDSKGNRVINTQSGKPIITSRKSMSDDGYASITGNVLYNLKDGTSTELKVKASIRGAYNDGLLPVYTPKDGTDKSGGINTWKYVDINSNVIIDTQIEEERANQDLGTYAAATFSHGYAVIRKNVNGKRVYGIIDTTGKETFLDTNKKYLEIGSVSAEGLAVAKVANDLYDYIDVYGNVVIPGGYYEAEKFYNGYAVVHRKSDKYYETEEVISGRKIYKNSGGYGVIDTKGRVVIPFGVYNYITNVSDTGLVWASRTYSEKELELNYTLEVLKISESPAESPAPPVESNAPAFTDVPREAYYWDPVQWAVDHGVTNGVSAPAS